MTATRGRLPNRRWHLAHGPIDLIIVADGDEDACAAAHEACWTRFQPVLDDLVAELDGLRTALDGATTSRLEGAVARRMVRACAPFARHFITPMAAVAGAVADELIGCFAVPGIRRASINNGGDIALLLRPGERFVIGVATDDAQLTGSVLVAAGDGVGGVASSGWRGRSLSFGIADRVTVLAHNAAAADAAATMIANAVDVDDPGILRAPAHHVRENSDLGERLVTVAVPVLERPQIERALDRGEAFANALLASGLIVSAALRLQGSDRLVQWTPERALRLAPMRLIRDENASQMSCT